MTMKKLLYAYRKTPNECNSEKIKQNNTHTGRQKETIEHRSAKRKQSMHIVGLSTLGLWRIVSRS
jgi:hypothetical protein